MTAVDSESDLSVESLTDQCMGIEPAYRMIFQVTKMYGISTDGMRMPLNEKEFIDSGQISASLDSEAPPTSNIGLIDFERRKLRVRYAMEVTFPGLYDLLASEKHDRDLLNPARAVIVDTYEFEPEQDRWHVSAKLNFLPGSPWAGAGGG